MSQNAKDKPHMMTSFGTLILAGSNSYSATTLTAGTLEAGNDGIDATDGTAAENSLTLGTGNITLDAGSTLAFNSSSPATFSNDIATQ